MGITAVATFENDHFSKFPPVGTLPVSTMTLKYELREVASHTKMDLSSQPGSKKSEVTERSDSPPLHIAEQVKFRMEGRGKSPIGTLSVYEKRVVWTDQDNPTVKSFAVSFSEVQSE